MYKIYQFKSIKVQNLIIVLLLISIMTSCEKDLLNQIPATSISLQSAYSTPGKIEAQVNGLYAQFGNPIFYGGRFLVFNEQRGEEFSQNDGNNATGANVWNQSITGSGDFVNSVWGAGYTAINSSNILIDQLSGTTIISDSLRKQFIAEAKFIRAFSYFSLIQVYSKPFSQNPSGVGLPLRLNGNTSGSQNDFIFSTVSEVYDQIIKDLNEAEADLPLAGTSALLTASHAHKASAIALKTRVYLVKGEYAKVIAEAAKLVSASAPFQYSASGLVHKLESNISSVFTGSYVGSEIIFTVPFINALEAPGSQSALSYNFLTPVLYLNKNGIYSDSVFSSSSSKDARKGLITTSVSNLKLLNKFKKNSAPFNDYVPVIRYAEVLLNYAEAAAETGDLGKALQLLYAIRNRSDVAFVYDTGISTKEDLVNTILRERRIELLGEGFRILDLLRRNQTLPGKSGNAGTAPEVLSSANNYVWPIPSNELAYNHLAPR